MDSERYAKSLLRGVTLWIMLPIIIVAHFYVGWLKGVLFGLSIGALVIYVLPFWMMVGFIPLIPLERWKETQRLRLVLGPAISWALALWIGWWLLRKAGVEALRPVFFWTVVVLGAGSIWDAARTPLLDPFGPPRFAAETSSEPAEERASPSGSSSSQTAHASSAVSAEEEESLVLTCRTCGAKNRLPASRRAEAICGRCRAPLSSE